MSFNRILTSNPPLPNYADGQILFGADVNIIIDVFKTAINANGQDIATILSGDREANVVTTFAALDLIEDQESGDQALVLNDEEEDGQTSLYTWNGTAWVLVYQISIAQMKEQLDGLLSGGTTAAFAAGTRTSAGVDVTTAAEIRDGVDDATAGLANSIANNNRLNKIEPKFDSTTLNNNIELFDQAVKTDSAVQFKSVAIVDPADTDNPSVTITKAKLADLNDTYKKQASDDRFINLNQRGVAGGVATLEAGTGRLPLSQLPLNTVVFRGQFGEGVGDLPDGSVNEPVETGDFYICISNGYESSVALDSEDNPITFDTGDKAVYDGENWSKIDNTESVTGVRGEEEPEGEFRIGNITITRENLGLENVANIAQVTSVIGTSPISSTGGTTPTISITAATTSAAGSMSSADKTKLDGIAESANNYVHPNHSGDVTSVADGATTIVDGAVTLPKMADLTAGRLIGNDELTDGVPKALTASEARTLLDVYDTGAVDTALGLKLDVTARGAVNGVASLNGDGKVPAGQLPSFVDDLEEYANLAGFPATGESDKIYVALDTGKIYRWSGSQYVEIAANEVNSVNTKTGAVTLTGEDIIIDAVDVDVDASGFTKILNTDDINVQLALAELDQHTHVESDITDLDKYTQEEVDAFLADKLDVGVLASNIILYPTSVPADVTGYFKLVTSPDDPDYDAVAQDITTAPITGQNILLTELISEPGIFVGNPGIINIPVVGQIRKAQSNPDVSARFYFEIYKRDDQGVEVLLGTSNETQRVGSIIYEEFNANALLDNGIFTESDRLVFKFYGNKVAPDNGAYQFKFGGGEPVRILLNVPISTTLIADRVFYDNSGQNLVATNVQDAVDELEQLIQENTTVIKIQKFEIIAADNGSGGFTYTYADGPASVTGTKSNGSFVFPLRDDVVYIPNNNRVEAKVNNDITFFYKDSELIEVDQATVAIDYTLQDGDEVFFKVYQGLDSVALVVPDGSVTTAKLSAPLQGKITDYDNHIASTANPHSVTASQIGLANVTNDAQVKKAASSTDEFIPKWSGTAGDAIVDGYGVQTTLSSSTTELVRADAIATAIGTKQDTLVSGTNIKTLNGTTLLGSGDYVIDIPSVKVEATAPANPNIGDLWWNTTNTVLYIYYNDGTSSQWVQVGYAELQAELAALIGAAPEALNTLEELAAALNDNPDVIDDLIQMLGQKADQSTVTSLTTTVNTKADKNATIENISADYTLLLTDNGKVKATSNTNPLTITIPTNGTVAFPIGSQIAFLRNGEGTVTFDGETIDVVINSKDSALSIAGQYASAALIKLDINTWQLIGSLE
jgi:hypothetical protein